MVTNVDRGRFTCVTNDGISLSAIKSRDLGRRGVVVGDLVRIQSDSNGNQDSLSRIVEIVDRKNTLRRSADDNDDTERIIVANVDLMVIVTATTNPEPRLGLIDRCLTAAFDAHIPTVLVITKSDLASPEFLLSQYQSMGLTIISLQKDGQIEELQKLLEGKHSVFIGHSGVGKSTLVNRLAPHANRATGTVNEVTGRGRHTSSSAVAINVGKNTWIIDTPGIRSFGLAHINADDVVHSFPDCAEVIQECPRGCSHDETECALNSWALNQDQSKRVESLRRLLRSLRSEEKF